MAGSTYSSNLKIELMTTGENSGTWGDVTNTNLGTALEQAVIGLGNPDYTSDANLTISITNSNASQAARCLVLNVTSVFGSLTQTRELVVPTIQTQYIVQNNTTGGQSITVKTSAGTGITVPNGRKAHLYVNGTDVIQMFDFVDINGGTIDGTAIGASSASTGAFTTLNASGATTLDGNVTLGNASGDTVTVTGTIASNLLFTDNTYDIGASGATRPRNLYLAGAATIGGNLSVGGTLTLTGGLTLNGNVTVGDSAADTLTINSTVTSNLIFTDNTYDIGASGATRPRNLFIAGNITAGGNQTLTGALTVDSTTDSSSTTTGSIQTDGGAGIVKNLYVGGNGRFSGNMTIAGVTPSAGGSISLTIAGAGGGGIEMIGSTNAGGAGFVPVAGGGAQFYSYSGAAGSESFTLRGQYNNSGNWALGASGLTILSNIGVNTYGGVYSDRGATSGATQTLFTMAASSGSNFGQISNTGATWGLGYGSAVNTTNPVLTWTAGNTVGINAGNPSATLEVSASFADSAIEEIARISRVGGSGLYGGNRAAALSFFDSSNGTLTGAIAGIRTTPSSDYNSSLGLYYNNTGGLSNNVVSGLTRAAVFGSYGALFAGAANPNTGTGLAIYSAGYTNLSLQSASSSYGSIIDFTEGSGNTLLYRMGVNHNSIGTGNFAFSYGTGPTGASWSVLSSGTFGAGNINFTNSDGGGGVRFVSNVGSNTAPQTAGTSQYAALRLRGGDNAILDFGLNSVNTWIQATDKANLANNYYIHLNPNGGTVTINGGTATPAISNGLFLQANSSTTEVFRIQGASTSGLYQTFYNGTISPLLIGYGGTLSAAATVNDAVIRWNGGYKLFFSSDGGYRAYFDTNGAFTADQGVKSSVSLGTTNGFNIYASATYNDNSAHTFSNVDSSAGAIHIRATGLASIPFYPNAGGGIAYAWNVLNPQTGVWTNGAGPTVNFTEASSSPNSYSVVFNGGGGSFTITRTSGTTPYLVAVQKLASS